MKRKARNSFIILSVILFVSVPAHLYISVKMNAGEKKEVVRIPEDCSSSVDFVRDNKKVFTHSLYMADANSESSKYTQLKARLLETILQNEQTGKIRNVSLYFINLNDASRMSINDDARYRPGSMIKVPIMICYLKEEQEHPGYLKTELYFDKPPTFLPAPKYKGESIKPGKKYTIAVLLKYMIEESDNYATYLLINNVKMESLRKIFTDLSIPDGDQIESDTFKLSPKEYSKFFRILYNTTYLNKDLSEYALKLLTRSKFNEGLTKKIPASVTVAHKFGEKGQNDVMEFSEAGIVYLTDTPYLLTVMTVGTDIPAQTALISTISGEIFTFLNKN